MVTKEKFYKDLGKRIKEIREQKGISLREFEQQEHAIGRSALSEIENGIKVPMLYTLYRIAVVLDVELEDFFKK